MRKTIRSAHHVFIITLFFTIICFSLIVRTALSSPTHNSDQFACSLPGFSTQEACTDNGGTWNPSRKWTGGWGVPSGQYGEFNCQTCHMKNPPNGNIKRIRSQIVAPEGAFPGGDVVDVKDIAELGNDSDNHASSERVCEVCHSKTSYHRFNTTGQIGGNSHFNLTDCIRCHRHNDGFRPDCASCHGNSASQTAWPDGIIANNVTDTYAWADDEAGSHETHVRAIGTGNSSCDNCHPGNPPVGHYEDNTTGVEQAEVIRMDTDNDGDAEYWEFLEGPTAVSGTAVYFKNTAGLGDPDAYYRFDNSIYNSTCYNIDCHGGAELQWGAKNGCLICHDSEQGSRVAVVGQFSANSHHIQNATLTAAHCYQCHWEANSDGTINPDYHGGVFNPGSEVDLVIYGNGSRPTNYSEDTTALRYIADGTRPEIESLNVHCLGCHSEQNSTTQPFLGDANTPQKYAWDRNATEGDGENDHLIVDADGTSIASRYNQTTSTPWGKYTVANTAPKALSKAYSAHGNAGSNEGGWSTSTGVDGTIVNSRANKSPGLSSVIACFDCHNSHGSSVSARATSYSSDTPYGGILKDTQFGYGGYSVAYTPAAGGSLLEKNEYNPGAALCFDCHLNSSPGSSFPWGYRTTFGANSAILGYADPPYFKSAGAGNQQRYAYKNLLDNKGGHFGASSELDATAMHSIDGLCTPCHDPHGVSPNLATNQQYSVPLLKGTWLTSPYREDVTPLNNLPTTGLPENSDRHIYLDQNTFGSNIKNFNQLVTGVTQNENQFAGLCLSCHPKTSLTQNGSGTPNDWFSKNRIHETVKGWKTSTGTIKHRFSCSKCHTPHSSGQPRLMVTNCMDRSHKGRVTWRSNPKFNGVNYWEAICNEGDGRIPGEFWYSEWCGPADGGPPPLPSYSNISCHEGYNNNMLDRDGDGNPVSGTVQNWNLLTQWGEPGLSLNALAAKNFAASATAGKVKATISWTSNVISNSSVDYGTTTAYGQTLNNSTLTTTHNLVLAAIDNHQTYHVKAHSTSYQMQNTSTADLEFQISVPPSVPILVPQSAFLCTSPGVSPDCDVTLDWNVSTDPDGGTIEYYIEVSTDPGFASSSNSGWITATEWATTLGSTNTMYYWRVRSRDQGHPDAISAWATSQIGVSDGTDPEVVLIAPVDGYAGETCDGHYDTSETDPSVWQYLAWEQGPLEFTWAVKPGTPPASEYELEVYRPADGTGLPLSYSSMSWTDTFSWSTDVLGHWSNIWYFTWRVRGRNSLTGLPGPWSEFRSFSLDGDQNCI